MRLKWIIDSYYREFGENNVKHVPIEDNHLCSFDILKGDILPFLQESYQKKKKVVVHCLGGNGRTGHVLAAWLAYKYKLEPNKAIAKIKQIGRDPTEAIIAYGNATMEELINLLTKCRDL